MKQRVVHLQGTKNTISRSCCSCRPCCMLVPPRVCLSVRLSRYVSCLLIGFSVIPLHFHFGFLLSLFCFKQLYFVFTVCLFMSLVHEYVSNSLMYIYHKKRKHTEKIYACDRICFIVYVCVCLCMCMYVCVLMCICVCVGMSI